MQERNTLPVICYNITLTCVQEELVAGTPIREHVQVFLHIKSVEFASYLGEELHVVGVHKTRASCNV